MQRETTIYNNNSYIRKKIKTMDMNLEERNKLIVQYMPLARRMAVEKKKKIVPYVHLDDLVAASYCGLVEAAEKYDENESLFSTYARDKISYALDDYLRESVWGAKSTNSRGYVKFESVDRILEYQLDTGENFFGDALVAKKSDFETVFQEMVEPLPETVKKIFWMLVMENKTLKEIGKELGFQYSWIHQLINKYKGKIAI